MQDSGPGISPEHREHLFDPFFSGRQAGRGLGFGLSKAWRIIQMHGEKSWFIPSLARNADVYPAVAGLPAD